MGLVRAKGECNRNRASGGKKRGRMNRTWRGRIGLSEIMSWGKCEQIQSEQTRKRDLMGQKERKMES